MPRLTKKNLLTMRVITKVLPQSIKIDGTYNVRVIIRNRKTMHSIIKY